MKKYRVKNDLEHQDTQFSILAPWKVGFCQHGKFCIRENEKMLFKIEGDPGEIGFCLECLLNLQKGNITFLNGKKVDIEKEIQRDNEDITEWTTDGLNEEIFNAEETMVNEYINGRGRKILTKYWQKLQDERGKRTD